MIALHRPGTSPVHRMPASAKLLVLALLAVTISLIPHSTVSLGIVGVGVIGAYLTAGFGPRVLARQLWLARWIVVFMVVSQLIFLTPWEALVNTVRVVAIIVLAGLLTLSTPTEELLDALRRGLRPLRRFGVDPQRVGLTLALTLSMLPVVAGFADRIRQAQRARGVRLGVRVVVPLLVMSLRHADDVADALTARGIE